MSDMISYGALRFKVKSEYTDKTQILKILRGIIGEPEDITFKFNWDGETFIKTDEVEYFSYPEIEGSCNIVENYDTCELFFDYYLFKPSTCCDDLSLYIPVKRILKLQTEILDKFSVLIEPDCNLVVYEYYNGCDMPVVFIEEG